MSEPVLLGVVLREMVSELRARGLERGRKTGTAPKRVSFPDVGFTPDTRFRSVESAINPADLT